MVVQSRSSISAREAREAVRQRRQHRAVAHRDHRVVGAGEADPRRQRRIEVLPPPAEVAEQLVEVVLGQLGHAGSTDVSVASARPPASAIAHRDGADARLEVDAR